MVRCNAKTKENKRCKREAESGKTKCWQHKSSRKKKSSPPSRKPSVKSSVKSPPRRKPSVKPSRKKKSLIKRDSRDNIRGHYGYLKPYRPRFRSTSRDKTRSKKCSNRSERTCGLVKYCRWKGNKCIEHFVRFK